MPKVSVILILWNSKKYIRPVMDAVSAQTASAFAQGYGGQATVEILAVINADDGAKAILEKDYPQVKVLDPGKNIGFAGGNNLGIRESTGEFIQLVNPDLVMEPDYIEKMLKAFDDPKIAAATGKLFRYDFEKNQKTNIIDSTGVVISASGRACDRGQNQVDRGQFELQGRTLIVFGVSGAGPMYRRTALERVAYKGEYFDEDFVAYWEDVDLSWRLNNAGFKNIYVPEAVAYHGRTAGQAKGGYLKIWNFIRHHRKLSLLVRQLNYKNHILMYIKNARFIFHPAFILRELAMFVYVLIFETSTLGVLPELFRQIPRALRKRNSSLRTK